MFGINGIVLHLKGDIASRAYNTLIFVDDTNTFKETKVQGINKSKMTLGNRSRGREDCTSYTNI